MHKTISDLKAKINVADCIRLLKKNKHIIIINLYPDLDIVITPIKGMS